MSRPVPDEPVSSRGPVGHPGSARHLTVLVVAFVVTVTGTRILLALSGYPRIGGTTYHLAHALWGGLLLTAAVVAMLLWANRWALQLGAVLAGVGVGLFIDEVGKFITTSNDYSSRWPRRSSTSPWCSWPGSRTERGDGTCSPTASASTTSSTGCRTSRTGGSTANGARRSSTTSATCATSGTGPNCATSAPASRSSCSPLSSPCCLRDRARWSGCTSDCCASRNAWCPNRGSAGGHPAHARRHGGPRRRRGRGRGRRPRAGDRLPLDAGPARAELDPSIVAVVEGVRLVATFAAWVLYVVATIAWFRGARLHAVRLLVAAQLISLSLVDALESYVDQFAVLQQSVFELVLLGLVLRYRVRFLPRTTTASAGLPDADGSVPVTRTALPGAPILEGCMPRRAETRRPAPGRMRDRDRSRDRERERWTCGGRRPRRPSPSSS